MGNSKMCLNIDEVQQDIIVKLLKFILINMSVKKIISKFNVCLDCIKSEFIFIINKVGGKS